MGLEPPPWLLRHRVAIPARSPGFFHRAEPETRCTPTSQRLTLLIAPGGFGKTTLLAECCRDVLERGVPVAWLALDSGDEPHMLESYLVHAFEAAGIDVLEPLRTGKADTAPPYPRAALLLRAVEAHADPVVLVLDEVERLSDPALVAVLNFVVRGAPTNLHLAVAGRELPPGLDLSVSVLGSDAVILTADELRFTRKDIAGYFHDELSPAELARVVSLSAGWPIALRIRHNEGSVGRGGEARIVRDVIENWVKTRLWYSFADDERELLLDVGLFDWIDAALLDEVLADRGGLQRLLALRTLDGLLERVQRDASEVWQLHPLIRDHCARQRRRETPARYRRIHGDIGRALARRGQIVAAMRHANQAEDLTLLATILLDAGGVRLWLREGAEPLVAADRLLPDEAIARFPRLVSVRCAALTATGQLAKARRYLETVPENPPSLTLREEFDLYVDRSVARALVAHYGCESNPTNETKAMMLHTQRLAEEPSFDPTMRKWINFSMCVHFNLHASFDAALTQGRRVQQSTGDQYPLLTLSVETQFGLIAMARGQTKEAYAWYRKCERVAKASFLQNPRLALLVNLLMHELDLERNRFESGFKAQSIPREVHQGAQLAMHFAATDIALELARAVPGPDDAMTVLDALSDKVPHGELPALVRHLAAWRVSLLADAGRVDEARQAWTVNALPETDADCFDLAGQSWREAESVSCARLRLLIALDEFDAARRLGEAASRIANERGLKRTAMRLRVLCLKLEHRAGDDEAASGHLVAFLESFAETDFARAIVREGEAAAAVLERFVQTHPDSRFRTAADGLLALIQGARTTPIPMFSKREMQVLSRLETDRDDDIAAALGITRYGVRYHVGNIFGKLKVHTRRDSVSRARDLGILPRKRQ